MLVVDDERNIRRALKMILQGEGAEVLEAETAEQALEIVARDRAEVLVMDVRLPGMSGIEALERLSRDGRGPAMPVILISGHATVSDAVLATRLGAFDFFEKPLERDRVIVGVRNALRHAQSDRKVRALESRVHGELVAQSDVMKTLLGQVVKVGPTKARVLITGESGTGKELIARAVHAASDRQQGPFVKVNCAAIPGELIESELFGHERGAFTGATAQKKGLFEVADGGTILLDEIGDMDLDAQAKVLRVLQSGEMMRVGGQAGIQVDVRVLAATHKNLTELVSEGAFREDLYFRLAVVPLVVPPLRDRPDDIGLLVEHFIEMTCEENGVNLKQIDDAARKAMQHYSWPGNVRELRNAVERMVVLSEGDLTLEDVPPEVSKVQSEAGDGQRGPFDDAMLETLFESKSDVTLRELREAVERLYILKRLREHKWNVSRTAQVLGVERTHLHRKMRALDITRGGS